MSCQTTLGQVAWRQEYQAFGADYNGSASGNPFKFNAKQLDNEFGLYYYGARYYDPATGRFTAPDPLTFVESPYAYCGNNPASMIDPTGMAEERPAHAPREENSPDTFYERVIAAFANYTQLFYCTPWQYDSYRKVYCRAWIFGWNSSLTDASGSAFGNYNQQLARATRALYDYRYNKIYNIMAGKVDAAIKQKVQGKYSCKAASTTIQTNATDYSNGGVYTLEPITGERRDLFIAVMTAAAMKAGIKIVDTFLSYADPITFGLFLTSKDYVCGQVFDNTPHVAGITILGFSQGAEGLLSTIAHEAYHDGTGKGDDTNQFGYDNWSTNTPNVFGFKVANAVYNNCFKTDLQKKQLWFKITGEKLF